MRYRSQGGVEPGGAAGHPVWLGRAARRGNRHRFRAAAIPGLHLGTERKKKEGRGQAGNHGVSTPLCAGGRSHHQLSRPVHRGSRCRYHTERTAGEAGEWHHSNASDVFGMAPDEGLQAFAAMREQAAQRIQRHVDNRSQTPARLSQQLRDDRSGGSMVSADIRNNALLIRDDPDKESMYRSLIERLDQPRNVIEIDAIILDVERGKLAELGINWRVGGGGMEATFNASGAEPFLARGSSATVLIQDFGHFFAQVRALESRGEATLVANPSILTIENQPAVIDFSATSFLSSIGERVASITPVTAGTSLQVIPRAIGNDSQRLVQLSLDIEDGNIEQDDGGDAGTPRVNRGTISTQAVIRADRSLVVGGFNVERSQDLSSKVPLLGDLPGVGKLFRYTSRHHSNRERLFILTPDWWVPNSIPWSTCRPRTGMRWALRSTTRNLATGDGATA
ncbi:EscC/YscC/HrcC family type III secretion system outer membrane ring protein [Billgrantia tianxiuensis]|uniref:EscC/YscC/HrcC family type III secretion system outer membrane ring protein n=2 Tax=Billgrantia tianxiuensis TaxID=2497861 RepID=A0A6I6SPT0_9GAMM|nr:EscC/YscC/HrcC family type III secretion system outer membrane ring protein [Halomonas tianxiuensis]